MHKDLILSIYIRYYMNTNHVESDLCRSNPIVVQNWILNVELDQNNQIRFYMQHVDPILDDSVAM